MTRVEELTLRLVDGELTEEEGRELDALIEADAAARRLHLSLLEQEAALRGRAEVELADATMARLREAIGARVAKGVVARLESTRSRYFRLLAAAAALALVVWGALVARSQLASAPPEELVLIGVSEMAPGRAASFRAVVVDAERGGPLAGVAVEARLLGPDGAEAWRGEAATASDGSAVFEAKLDAQAGEGGYQLALVARAPARPITVQHPIQVRRSYRLLLVSDKPHYQPGQTMHLRALALDAVDRRPIADGALVFEIYDGKGNKVFKRAVETSRFGLAAADFTLADQVVTGGYRVSAALGDTRSERQVNVARYALPRFAVELATDKPHYRPGEAVKLTLAARYTFGEPVSGAKVRARAAQIVAESEIEIAGAAVEATSDGEGNAALELRIPERLVGSARDRGDARVAIEVTVTDAAGEERALTIERVVAAQPIRIDVVPESRATLSGGAARLFVVTSYPDGAPAKTEVRVGGGARVATSASGVAQLTVTESDARGELTIEASDAEGRKASRVARLGGRASPLLLRPERAIYHAGDTLRAEVIVSEAGPVFVDVVHDGRSVSVHTVETNAGAGELVIDLPDDVSGSVALSAYRVARDGTLVGDARLVQVLAPSELSVRAELDRPSYRPGESARVSFTVTRPDGSPAPSALSLAAVDEAVYALTAAPALAESQRQVARELLEPHAEVATLPPAALARAIEERDEALAQAALAAQLGGPKATLRGGHSVEANALRSEKRRELSDLLAGLGALATLAFFALTGPLWLRVWARVRRPEPEREARPELAALGRRVTIGWLLAWALPPLGVMLAPRGTTALVVAGLCVIPGVALIAISARRFARSGEDRPLGRAVVALPFALGAALVAVVAPSIAMDERDHEALGPMLLVVVVATLVTTGAVSAATGAAAQALSRRALLWRLVSRGALALVGVAVAGALVLTRAMPANDEMGGAIPAMAPVSQLEEKPAATGDIHGGPRLRRDFPETLLWRPELVTDERGHATLEVPLADSITTWRLGASAVSAGGELGATSVGVRVFQEFFVDLGLPVALTQNDAVSVPAAVFNYGDRPLTVALELAPAPWYELEGPAKREVTVPARGVGRVELRVVAKRPGVHALRLGARAGELADAVERQVRVAPDGEEVVATDNGVLDSASASSAERHVVVPEQAIEGADDLALKIYPGALSQVIEGLDGVFRMPSGCFEQTSSVTYPSVLVLDYLERAGRMPPELELRARGYISAGYQRLLSFEVPGGGFEWFGKPPAHTVLSAYGVLEFHDMARVHEVDAAVIARTEEWLYRGQRADGAFAGSHDGIHEGAVNAMVGDDVRTTAYVAWALAEARAPGSAVDPRLRRALDYVAAHAGGEDDAYTLALAAMALYGGEHPSASGVLARLDARKEELAEGRVRWTSKARGVTHSHGDALTIETTAIAAQAYLRAGFGLDTAERALAFLVAEKDPAGTWRSTTATVQAMRALLAGADAPKIDEPVEVAVLVDGQPVERVRITPDTSDVFRLLSLREHAGSGSRRVRLELSGKGRVSYQLVATHYLPRRQAATAVRELTLAVRYEATELRRGELLPVTAEVRWNGGGTLPMTMVDLGIPPGFRPHVHSLEALVESGVIERYSLAGSQLLLYLRKVESGRPLSLRWSLVATQPVVALAPAARAYPYYEPELEAVAPPIRLTVR